MPLPNFFTVFQSSKSHRNKQRINAFSEAVLKGTLPNIASDLIQTANSIVATVSQDLHTFERVEHAIQAAVATAKLGLSLAIFVQGKTCPNAQDASNIPTFDLCQAYFLMDIIYKSFLALGWGPSEFYKDDPNATEAADVPAAVIARR